MKLILKVILPLIIFTFYTQGANLKITNLRCEYKVNPIGVDIPKPRFSWNIESGERGTKQIAYQIYVSSNLEKLEKDIADNWNSGKIITDKSIQIFYAGKNLESNKKYFWKVKVWDEKNNIHTSEIAYWTTGLFSSPDSLSSGWKAKWIGLDKAIGDDAPDLPHRILSARMLRHEFNSDKKIKRATVFISGLGLYELYINGKKIGNQVLAPALSEYNKTTYYNTFDVTEHIKNNKNAIGIILGNGRYFAPRNKKPIRTRTYGFPKVICQLEIEYEDGATKTIVTDETWKLTTNGPIRKNNEYDGEFYDARMELPGWNKINFDDSQWMNAELVGKPGLHLIAQPNEPIKIMDELLPVSINEVEPEKFIFDMGQNMVGWVELFVKGKRGDTVKLRFAETLKEDGNLFLDNIRSAEVTDTYVLKGDGEENWEPRFTYHGFRFVEMTGYPGIATLKSIKGKVVHDALEVTGNFECSNSLINQIYKNAYWGIRGNYRSMPTDCPQRDERQGWLGDRAAECKGESFIFDISKLYNKWANDIKDAQKESGSIPDVAPSYWPFYNDNTTWAGAYLFISDMLYNQYGDLKTIQIHYPAMKKWIEYMSGFMKENIMPKDTYGDWCVPPEDLKLIHTDNALRTTSAEYIGTAYFYYELKLMEKFAKLLNKKDDENKYSSLSKKIKKAFNKKFLDKKNIKYSNNSHTVNILALAFNLVPDKYKNQIVDNLLQKILAESNMHVGNGIVGGQWLMRTLSNTGHADIAYALAAQNTYPSWGYMVEHGATTIWELWNGDHGDPAMNSGNHVMLLGDLIIWFYENLAGIKADAPAFKKIIMKPQVSDELSFVNASYKSIYGKIQSNWKLDKNSFRWDVKIPSNTTATVYVPTVNKEVVMEGNKPAANSYGVKFIKWENNYAVFNVVPGVYSFSSNGVTKKRTKRFVVTPKIIPGDTILFNEDKIYAEINCEDSEATIYYTLNGTVPSKISYIYNSPLEIEKSTRIKARAYKKDLNPSSIVEVKYDFVDSTKNGIIWELYLGAFKKIPEFDKINPVARGKTYQFKLNKIELPKYNFALRFYSSIEINKSGEYDFYTSSNDGSKLYIDNKLVVDNDGEHGPKQLSGNVFLNKGKHAIRVEYFQSGGSKSLSVYYRSKEVSFGEIPSYLLFKN